MKKVIEFIKELKKKPYGKGVFFFGFYLIFFIVVFIILGLGGNNKNKETETISGISVKYLEKYNYSFQYKVVVDNKTYDYIGNKNNNTFKYTYEGKEYNYEDKRFEFNKFFDESIVDEITKSSYIDSKTVYAGGEIVYNLLVSSNTLNKIIDGNDTDFEEIPNKIKVTINNGFVNEISYDLNSYCVNNDNCNKLSIIINYKEFSKIS